MSVFRVLSVGQSGLALLESDDAQAVKGRLDLYLGKEKKATVVDTIAQVKNPLYLAQSIGTLQKEMTLTPKR